MKKLICYRGRFNTPKYSDNWDLSYWDLPYQYCRKRNFDRNFFDSVEKVEVTAPDNINGYPTTLSDIDMSHYYKGKPELLGYKPEYDQITVKVLEEL